MPDKNEAQTVYDLAMAAASLSPEGVGCFLPLPEGFSAHSLEDLQATPNRMRGDVTFRDTQSLAAYLARFEKPHSVAFSNPASAQIEVEIDHHDHAGDTPGFSEHRAHFHAQYGTRYKAWRDISGRAMSQLEAGVFLEDHALSVKEPDAATVMDMVMQFDALKKVTFKQSTRLHDGQREFQYTEENEARGNVRLPEEIILLVAVYEGQEPDRIRVKVRYRITDGKLRFQFDIHDREDLERKAFERCENALAVARPDLLVTRVV